MLIEQYFDWPDKPETKQPHNIKQALATPETELIDLACKVQDMFILYDESGDIRCSKTPTLKALIPSARKMAEMVIERGKTGPSLRLATNLLKWIDAPKQKRRAWNIRALAQWLADDIMDNPKLDKAVDGSGIPF